LAEGKAPADRGFVYSQFSLFFMGWPPREPLRPEEIAFKQKAKNWYDEKGGYWHVQATQPQTLGFALNDSPMGLAAWLIDKYRDWADCAGVV
jgi:hypothetical protein